MRLPVEVAPSLLTGHNADIRAPVKVTQPGAVWCTVFDHGRSAQESSSHPDLSPPYFPLFLFHPHVDPHPLTVGAPLLTADTCRTGSNIRSVVTGALYICTLCRIQARAVCAASQRSDKLTGPRLFKMYKMFTNKNHAVVKQNLKNIPGLQFKVFVHL